MTRNSFSESERSRCVALRAEGMQYWKIADALNTEFHGGNRVRTGDGIRNQFRYLRTDSEEQEDAPVVEQQSNTSLLRKANDRLKQERDRAQEYTDNVIEAIRESIVALPQPNSKTFFPKPSRLTRVEDAHLLVSDLQLGEKVSRMDTGGINEWNYNIFDRQLDYLMGRAIEVLEIQMHGGAKFRTLNIDLLGDMVDNESIYPGHAFHIEFGVIDQLILGADRMSRFVNSFSGTGMFDKVVLRCVYGNHANFRGKGTKVDTKDNWDYLFYRMMQMHLAENKDVEWDIPQSYYCNYVSQGWKYLLTHGHEIRGWMGLPHYGLQRRAGKNTAMFSNSEWHKELQQDVNRMKTLRPFDVWCIGHHHQSNYLSSGDLRIFINGCFPGGNTFSMQQLGEAGDPKQWIFGSHSNRPVTWMNELDLSDK